MYFVPDSILNALTRSAEDWVAMQVGWIQNLCSEKLGEVNVKSLEQVFRTKPGTS